MSEVKTLSLANEKTKRKTDFIGRPETGVETLFEIEGRPGYAVSVTTMKGHGGARSHARLCTYKVENGFVCMGFTMFQGAAIHSDYPEVKRFTQKIAEEKHAQFLATLKEKVANGSFNLAAQV